MRPPRRSTRARRVARCEPKTSRVYSPAGRRPVGSGERSGRFIVCFWPVSPFEFLVRIDWKFGVTLSWGPSRSGDGPHEEE